VIARRSAARAGILALATALAALGTGAQAAEPVSESDIRAAYDRLVSVPPVTEYDVRHILVASQAQAQQALDRIHRGEDFAAVAREVSIDTGSAQAAGGDLGWNLATSFVQEFAREMVALAPQGRSSAPVHTQFGWHVLEVRGARPKAVASLDEMHEHIATGLARARQLAAQATSVAYSADERARLGLCAAMTDNAYSLAHRRMAFETIESARQLYADAPEPARTEMLALVDKVWSDTVMSDWSYANQFFFECTQKLTPVARPRLGRAGYCLQNRLVAASTYAAKRHGDTRQVAQGRFAYFDSPATLGVIDNVYANDKTLVQVEADAWDRCIGDPASPAR